MIALSREMPLFAIEVQIMLSAALTRSAPPLSSLLQELAANRPRAANACGWSSANPDCSTRKWVPCWLASA